MAAQQSAAGGGEDVAPHDLDDDLYGDIEEAENAGGGIGGSVGGGGNGDSGGGGGGNPRPRSSDKYDPEEAIEISVRHE